MTSPFPRHFHDVKKIYLLVLLFILPWFFLGSVSVVDAVGCMSMCVWASHHWFDTYLIASGAADGVRAGRRLFRRRGDYNNRVRESQLRLEDQEEACREAHLLAEENGAFPLQNEDGEGQHVLNRSLDDDDGDELFHDDTLGWNDMRYDGRNGSFSLRRAMRSLDYGRGNYDFPLSMSPQQRLIRCQVIQECARREAREGWRNDLEYKGCYFYTSKFYTLLEGPPTEPTIRSR